MALPIIGWGLGLAGMGAALGLAVAWAVSRVLTRFLFGVSATDPATFAAAALLLVSVTAVASYLPSRRAVRIDPVVALRAD